MSEHLPPCTLYQEAIRECAPAKQGSKQRERKNGNGRSKGQVKRIWVIVIGDPGVTTCTRLSRQPNPDSSRPEGSKRKLAKKMECIKNVSLLNAFRGDSDDWQRLGVNLMIT